MHLKIHIYLSCQTEHNVYRLGLLSFLLSTPPFNTQCYSGDESAGKGTSSAEIICRLGKGYVNFEDPSLVIMNITTMILYSGFLRK